MLSPARFNALYTSMSSVARKVYDVVPIQEEWTVQQITMEIHRARISVRVDVLAGCLETLRRAGLICEPRRGCFRRVGVREPKALPTYDDTPNTIAEDTPMAKPSTMVSRTPPAPLPPLDRLGDLAQRVVQLSAALKDVAAELSDAAVDIQAQLEHGEEDLKKLRQLQTLLKSIGE